MAILIIEAHFHTRKKMTHGHAWWSQEMETPHVPRSFLDARPESYSNVWRNAGQMAALLFSDTRT